MQFKFLILIILSRGSDGWGALAALTWVGLCFFLLVDSIQHFHKLPSSITADLSQLAMLLTPGVKHLFLFRHILEARPELKFHGIYRLENRFSKFVWKDSLILTPDLLEGLCAEVSMECETTLRYALQLRLLGDMHSDMIGLKNL